MALSTADYLKRIYDNTKQMGRKSKASDYTMQIIGFEDYFKLTSQFPWPVATSQGNIEVAMPLGMNSYEQQQIKTAHEGQIAFCETEAGAIDQLLIDLIAQGGWFDAIIYHGVPSKHIGGKRIQDCFLVLDDVDTNWEDRSTIVKFSGNISYHYFNETVPGNANRI